MGSHSVTCYPTQLNALRANPSPHAGTGFAYPGEMEGWVDLGYPAMHRPGVTTHKILITSPTPQPSHLWATRWKCCRCESSGLTLKFAVISLSVSRLYGTSLETHRSIGVGDGGDFSGNYYVKFGNFRAKIMWYSEILLTFRANIIKIRVFCYLFGQT